MTQSNTLYHVEKGKGLPVVLVHGFPLDGRMWEQQVAALSDRYRVVAVDLPEFGKSASRGEFTMDSLAEAIHDHLVAINARPCVLAGLSMGGYIALAFAKKYPSDLVGLMLVDTKAEEDTAQAKEGRGKMIEVARTQGSKAIAEQMMPKMISEQRLKHSPAVVGRLREIMENCPAKTIEHALAAMRDRPDRTEMLASIAAPTLIIVGQEDAITPPKVAEEMKKQIPKAELVIVPGAGHMSPMEQPSLVTNAMRQFLERVAAQGKSGAR